MLDHTPRPSLLRALPPNYVFNGRRRASVGESEQEELERKINALADARYGAHGPAELKALFLSYDVNGDGCASRKEVGNMLRDAGVGNAFTRGLWVDGVFKQLDTDNSGCITWEEYKAGSGITEAPPPPPPPPAPPAGGGDGGYTIAKEIAAGSKLPTIQVSKELAPATPKPKPAAEATEGLSTGTYAGAAAAAVVGGLFLGPLYGVALGAGWLLSASLAR
jgi:hypothetical protein